MRLSTYAAIHTHISRHTLTHSYGNFPSSPTASVHVCPVLAQGAVLQGVHVAGGAAASQRAGVGLGMGGGRVLGEEGSLVETGERQDSRPAKKTSPGDLLGEGRFF